MSPWTCCWALLNRYPACARLWSAYNDCTLALVDRCAYSSLGAPESRSDSSGWRQPTYRRVSSVLNARQDIPADFYLTQ